MAKAPIKPLTKTELLANIATATELPKTQVLPCSMPWARDPEEPRQQGRRRHHAPRSAEDREEEGSRPVRPRRACPTLSSPAS